MSEIDRVFLNKLGLAFIEGQARNKDKQAQAALAAKAKPKTQQTSTTRKKLSPKEILAKEKKSRAKVLDRVLNIALTQHQKFDKEARAAIDIFTAAASLHDHDQTAELEAELTRRLFDKENKPTKKQITNILSIFRLSSGLLNKRLFPIWQSGQREHPLLPFMQEQIEMTRNEEFSRMISHFLYANHDSKDFNSSLSYLTRLISNTIGENILDFLQDYCQTLCEDGLAEDEVYWLPILQLLEMRGFGKYQDQSKAKDTAIQLYQHCPSGFARAFYLLMCDSYKKSDPSIFWEIATNTKISPAKRERVLYCLSDKELLPIARSGDEPGLILKALSLIKEQDEFCRLLKQEIESGTNLDTAYTLFTLGDHASTRGAYPKIVRYLTANIPNFLEKLEHASENSTGDKDELVQGLVENIDPIWLLAWHKIEQEDLDAKSNKLLKDNALSLMMRLPEEKLIDLFDFDPESQYPGFRNEELVKKEFAQELGFLETT